MTGVLKRRDTQGDDHATTEAEIGVIHTQPRNTKDCQQTPEAGKCKQRFSPRGFRGSKPLLTS